MSSASTKEGWLSEDACREGIGISMVGVPDRLMGLEKLKEGRGRGAETSELTEGDRR